jgi:hypothetical protein
MTDLFPYNPKSLKPASSIDWAMANPLSWEAPFKVWKKVNVVDIQRLMSEPQNARIYKSLAPDVQEKLLAVAEGRNPVAAAPPPKKSGTEKEALLALLEKVLGEAEEAGDLTAALRTIELRAKIHSLLNTKVNEDERVITITVDTGVVR